MGSGLYAIKNGLDIILNRIAIIDFYRHISHSSCLTGHVAVKRFESPPNFANTDPVSAFGVACSAFQLAVGAKLKSNTYDIYASAQTY